LCSFFGARFHPFWIQKVKNPDLTFPDFSASKVIISIVKILAVINSCQSVRKRLVAIHLLSTIVVPFSYNVTAFRICMVLFSLYHICVCLIQLLAE
jgi:hypothetical protein